MTVTVTCRGLRLMLRRADHQMLHAAVSPNNLHLKATATQEAAVGIPMAIAMAAKIARLVGLWMTLLNGSRMKGCADVSPRVKV